MLVPHTHTYTQVVTRFRDKMQLSVFQSAPTFLFVNKSLVSTHAHADTHTCTYTHSLTSTYPHTQIHIHVYTHLHTMAWDSFGLWRVSLFEWI